MSRIPGAEQSGTRSWKVNGLWIDLLGPLTTYGNEQFTLLLTPYGGVTLLTVEELLAERIFAARKWTGFNYANDQCARKLIAAALRGGVSCDWLEVERIAALPVYECLPEVIAMRQEVLALLGKAVTQASAPLERDGPLD